MKGLLLCVVLIGACYGQTRAGLGVVRVKDEKQREMELYKGSFALLIGASHYNNGWSKLPGVQKDIHNLKKALETNGFFVVTVMNPSKNQLTASIDQFIKKYGTEKENRLLVFYSGHGKTLKQSWGDEMGYIVPVDTPDPNKDLEGFRAQALDMQMFEVYAKRIQSKHALFLFDSCFSGALFALSKAAPAAINYKTAEAVRQFITAGNAEEEVPDDSIFCRQFIAALQGEADGNKDGYVTGSELGEFLQTTVVNYSYESQHPQYGKIRNPKLDKGDFVFVVPDLTPPPPPPRPRDPLVKPVIETKMRYGSLRVSSLGGGTLYLDSERIQAIRPYEEATLSQIPAGYHEIRIVSKGFEEVQERVLLEPEQVWSKTYRPKEIRVELQAGARKVLEIKGISFAFRWCPPGRFLMGSPASEPDREVDESQHEVVLSRGYWLMETELTQRQWEVVMGTNPSYFKGEDRPVEQVSWEDAQAFIRAANAALGGGLRLPTEAEWEYACRAGTTGAYAGSLERMGWYDDNSGSETHPVGQKEANAWGLKDLHGNVWEWCSDWKDAYPGGKTQDPVGPSTGQFRVIRGGSWYFCAGGCRSANRNGGRPSYRDHYLGFRLALGQL